LLKATTSDLVKNLRYAACYVWLCNQQLPQSALDSKPSALHAMEGWQKRNPELFKKQPYYLAGCDS